MPTTLLDYSDDDAKKIDDLSRSAVSHHRNHYLTREKGEWVVYSKSKEPVKNAKGEIKKGVKQLVLLRTTIDSLRGTESATIFAADMREWLAFDTPQRERQKA